MGRHIGPHDRSRADDGVMADRDPIENLRARAHHAPGPIVTPAEVRVWSSTDFDGSEKS